VVGQSGWPAICIQTTTLSGSRVQAVVFTDMNTNETMETQIAYGGRSLEGGSQAMYYAVQREAGTTAAV
jgi:hypothetical protein